MISYAWDMAPFGQTSKHEPQSLHRAGSMTYTSSPAVIAPSAHSLSQAPHIMQSELITWVMTFPFVLERINFSG